MKYEDEKKRAAKEKKARERAFQNTRKGHLRAAARVASGLPPKKSAFEAEAEKLAEERLGVLIGMSGETSVRVMVLVRDAVTETLARIYHAKNGKKPGPKRRADHEEVARLVTERFARAAEKEDELVFLTRNSTKKAFVRHSLESLEAARRVAEQPRESAG